jgi:glycosyltransferase involved in cell wall biosynthesis
MNAVIVDGDVSYPPCSGKRLRTLNLMLRLARRHHIAYICRADAGSPDSRAAADFLGDHGIETIVVDHPVPRKAGPLFYARLAANLFSPVPYSVATHDSRQMRRAVADYAAAHPVDLWQFEWTPYADALPNRDTIRKLIIAHNVDSLLWQRYHDNEPNPVKRWYIKGQWRKFERFERRAFRAVTRVVAVSPDDARILREQFGVARVDVVENGIDRSYYEAVQTCRDPHDILFLGSLEWRPNLDGVRLMLDQVFPAVLAREPAARLTIVGRNPPDWLVQRVGSLNRVRLHGNVADVRPFLGRSGVMAVPLRIGGGSRLKILEALAAGLPVVSTRIGAEGLCLRPGHDLEVVERVEDMAAALVDAVRAPDRAQAMAENGRRLVVERYDWDPLADKLERAWEKCVGVEAVLASGCQTP